MFDRKSMEENIEFNEIQPVDFDNVVKKVIKGEKSRLL